MKNTIWKSLYFFGNKVSEYGQKEGYIDYRTLAKAFDAVLNNEIMGTLESQGFYFEQVNGFIDEEEEEQDTPEIFQYYIISDNGANILQDYTDEILFYNEDLDLYIWGVTHYGTSWDYVLTDIKIDLEKE